MSPSQEGIGQSLTALLSLQSRRDWHWPNDSEVRNTTSCTAERRCLFRAEVLQEIADNAARVTNDGLKTVDEAAAEDGAEDGAEEPTPDAMD